MSNSVKINWYLQCQTPFKSIDLLCKEIEFEIKGVKYIAAQAAEQELNY